MNNSCVLLELVNAAYLIVSCCDDGIWHMFILSNNLPKGINLAIVYSKSSSFKESKNSSIIFIVASGTDLS